MSVALELAQRASVEQTFPNPRVGAVIVVDGFPDSGSNLAPEIPEKCIIGRGYHRLDGGPHAERVAIDSVSESGSLLWAQSAKSVSLYVTLEPCSTEGRTGSCCQLIVDSGYISRVVVGATDPNPLHQGRGLALLQEAGIEVCSGCLEDECNALNPLFNNYMNNLPKK